MSKRTIVDYSRKEKNKYFFFALEKALFGAQEIFLKSGQNHENVDKFTEAMQTAEFNQDTLMVFPSNSTKQGKKKHKFFPNLMARIGVRFFFFLSIGVSQYELI